MMTLPRILSLNTTALALCAVGLIASAPPVSAQETFQDLVVFGDSLSDTGNGFTQVRESATPPDFGLNPFLVPSAPYARGGHHFTNGATWIEYFARPLGLVRYVQPVLRSASPDAMNFAVATLRARDDGFNPSLAERVAAYLQKTGGLASPDTLYVIEIGGNDVRDALSVATAGGDPFPILEEAAISVAASIGTLYAAGARQFLVWNVPDVGRTPAVGILDSQFPGASALATLLTVAYNQALAFALIPASALPGIRLVTFDAFALISAIALDPSQFGMTHVTQPCVTPDVPPFFCGRPDQYLFWDGIHPTTETHAIIARAVAAALGLP